MAAVAAVVSILLLVTVLWDAFETVVLPRRASFRHRLTRLFYKATWRPYRVVAVLLRGRRRESFLGFFGPLSMIFLLAVWAFGLVLGFAGLHWALGSSMDARGTPVTFATYVYMSGTTFFTLGLGDVVPHSAAARSLTVLEAGLGFGFLALVIGYLPVLYGAFSRREVAISMLDARAGSPPSAGELLKRHGERSRSEEFARLLQQWELWAAELMESHLSYPVLCYYRSQHDNQSWLSALTTVLDACALTLAGVEGPIVRQAKLTFAIARHAVVDLVQVFKIRPTPPIDDRLPPDLLARLRADLAAAGVPLCSAVETGEKLAELRRMYEPHVNALSEYLLMRLPGFATSRPQDNWQTSTWENASISGLRRAVGPDEEH